MAPARAQQSERGVPPAQLARHVAIEYEHRAAEAERDGHTLVSEELYRRALGADPGYAPPYLACARLLEARGRTSEARAVLAAMPPRAYDDGAALVDLARARASLGDTDGALALLGTRRERSDVAQARAQIAARAGRFVDALAAARFLYDQCTADVERERVRTLVAALEILAGELDAVRHPGAEASVLRRALADSGN